MKSTNPIGALFGRSPFKPMQEHMRFVNDCVAQTPLLFEALIAGDPDSLETIKTTIFAWEDRANGLKHQIRLHLPRSLFMPVDRRDLLDLLDRQDAIADTAKDIASLLVQREIPVPLDLRDDLRALVLSCTAACAQAMAVIDELDELIETGFQGAEATRVEQMVEELDRRGRAADALGMALARSLFRQEDRMDPVTVIVWHQLIQWVGNLADGAEKVGDHLLPLIAR
ncbi:TIGR00153 family protein [Thiocystis violascens]|uniref:TIGR00153 family protein n=1 Tax=Thiocystis violascens (strain ATCC 17096 / DSM 198 / 6111) TaxID=765911 RepID=I3Y5V0_THIV6|nr:TIGR00153 family protein [Thiocystis violascens]AFL72368.1 TIGR00153 family protein [Thiocystis violascens DSM 198]